MSQPGAHMEEELVSQPGVWERAAAMSAEQALLPAAGQRVAVIGCGTSWFMAQSYAAAREAALKATQDAAIRAGVDPTTAAGMNSMTPAQVERELKRQQKAIDAAQAKAAREAERQRRAEEKAAQVAARDRQRTIDTAIRAGGKVASSRLGQDILRGVFGTLFGGGKSR